jgi:tRNA(Ile2) C34 agmatinyltransferase TiaS
MNGELLISIDDTDVEGGEGTGRLARRIARELNLKPVGITRHQLFLHPSIDYTKRNSCNVIILESESAPIDVFEAVKEIILDRFQKGSDPGLAVADIVPDVVMKFGRSAQRSVLTKQDSIKIGKEANIRLKEIGGSGEGIIGALAGIGLCSSGNDGRYIMLEGLRELRGEVSIPELIEMGIDTIVLDNGERLEEGSVAMADKIRPSRLDGKPVLFVGKHEGAHYPVVL